MLIMDRNVMSLNVLGKILLSNEVIIHFNMLYHCIKNLIGMQGECSMLSTHRQGVVLRVI